MNPEIIKSWLKANKKDRHWLARQCGVHKQTVDGWLSAGRPISTPAANILAGLIKGKSALNPRVTLDEYNKAQKAAAAQGQTLEEWISSVIVAALKLLILVGVLWFIAA